MQHFQYSDYFLLAKDLFKKNSPYAYWIEGNGLELLWYISSLISPQPASKETTSYRMEEFILQNWKKTWVSLVNTSTTTCTIFPCSGPTVTPTSLQEDISTCLPTVRRFIEDHAREWRELDYHIEVVHTVSYVTEYLLTIFLKVGKPLTSFCSFLRQYDWNIFTADGLTDKVDFIISTWI